MELGVWASGVRIPVSMTGVMLILMFVDSSQCNMTLVVLIRMRTSTILITPVEKYRGSLTFIEFTCFNVSETISFCRQISVSKLTVTTTGNIMLVLMDNVHKRFSIQIKPRNSEAHNTR